MFYCLALCDSQWPGRKEQLKGQFQFSLDKQNTVELYIMSVCLGFQPASILRALSGTQRQTTTIWAGNWNLLNFATKEREPRLLQKGTYVFLETFIYQQFWWKRQVVSKNQESGSGASQWVSLWGILDSWDQLCKRKNKQKFLYQIHYVFPPQGASPLQDKTFENKYHRYSGKCENTKSQNKIIFTGVCITGNVILLDLLAFYCFACSLPQHGVLKLN